jgi:hypothetical protein
MMLCHLKSVLLINLKLKMCLLLRELRNVSRTRSLSSIKEQLRSLNSVQGAGFEKITVATQNGFLLVEIT